MRFSTFIEANLFPILAEWDAFAKTILPAAAKMSDSELRDHAREVLLAIAQDMETAQSEEERSSKSKRMTLPAGMPQSAASTHGAGRLTAGFDLVQLVGEFRALRASVLKLWSRAADDKAAIPAAEEIARFNEALDQALAESVERYSDEATKSRDMFLAVLGHDLRGPLSSIRLAADALETPSVSERMRDRLLQRIRRGVDTVGRLSTDLLDYTRSRLGNGILVTKSACDLTKVCEDALDSVQGSYPDQQFTMELSGDLRTECDVPRMQQVMLNLLHNAVSHGNPSRPVRLEVIGETDSVVIKVRNSGAAIPPESLEVIFQPLVQLAGSGPESKRHSTGLGLGLYIASEIVRGHGGTIDVESTEAETVFTVRLPRTSAV